MCQAKVKCQEATLSSLPNYSLIICVQVPKLLNKSLGKVWLTSFSLGPCDLFQFKKVQWLTGQSTWSSWHLTGFFPFLTVLGFFLNRFQMWARNPRAHPCAVRSLRQGSVKGLHFQVQDEWSLRNFPDIADSMITSLFFLCHLAWMPPTFFRWFEQRTHQKV